MKENKNKSSWKREELKKENCKSLMSTYTNYIITVKIENKRVYNVGRIKYTWGKDKKKKKERKC